MKKIARGSAILTILMFCNVLQAQITAPKFGSGIRIMGQDSSFYMKVGFRFQTLFTNNWNITDDDSGSLNDHESAIFIRRSRLKFDGWAVSPKFKYKAELALSNRDNGGGNSSEFSNAANIILDASISWNFYKGFSIWLGQGKMPGNRERIISSGNLQFVDRSRLNSRFTLDRDVGAMLIHEHKIGKEFILKETLALVSGEGKNITTGNIGGSAYTFKIEAFPFGKFQSKGAYVGSAVKNESKPKLAFAVAYDINKNAGRTRGQKGSFLYSETGEHFGDDLNTLFVDLMFKYRALSVMIEYVDRAANSGSPEVFDLDGTKIGTYYTGSAANFAIGLMTKKNWEIAYRWTDVNPDAAVANEEEQYTLGLSKFIVGHKLKVQTDLTYRAINEADNELIYRMQMDLHF